MPAQIEVVLRLECDHPTHDPRICHCMSVVTHVTAPQARTYARRAGWAFKSIYDDDHIRQVWCPCCNKKEKTTP